MITFQKQYGTVSDIEYYQQIRTKHFLQQQKREIYTLSQIWRIYLKRDYRTIFHSILDA